jgi:hypothetical protein
MLRSRTKNQLTYSPHNQLAYLHRKQFSYYPQKGPSYYPQRKLNFNYLAVRKFTYYHLIAVFAVGLLGGWAINHIYNHLYYHSLGYSSSVKESSHQGTVNGVYSTTKITEKQAFNAVWNLPQVQRKAKEIEELSQGNIKVAAVIDSLPTTNKPFYIVKVFENHPDKTTSPVYWFRVSNSSGVIEPLDLVENQYISLQEWNPDGI